MSRVGNKHIVLPEKVEASINASNVIQVKGPKGVLTQNIDPDIKVSINAGIIQVERPTEQKRHKSMHGLYRSLINNMVKGVSEGYKVDLELVGVGYKASANNNVLEFSLGYSHSVFFVLPPEVKSTTLTEKGKNPVVTLESNDKQLIGQIAAKIRSFRKTEPYKGKGIKFSGEQLRRKAGKTSAKK